MRDSYEHKEGSNRQAYRNAKRKLESSTEELTDSLLRDAGPLPPIPVGSIARLKAISPAYSRTNWADPTQLRALLRESLGLRDDVLDGAVELLALNAGSARAIAATGNPPSRSMLDDSIRATLGRSLPRSVSEVESQALQRKNLVEIMKNPDWRDLVLKLGRDTGGYLQRRGSELSESAFVSSLESAVQASFDKDRVFLKLQARALGMNPTEMYERYKSIALGTGAASNRTTLITSLSESAVNEAMNPARGQLVCARGTFSFGYGTLLKNSSPFHVAHDFYGVAVRSERHAPGETSQVIFPRLCLERSVFDKLTAHPEGNRFLERLKTIATLTDHDYLHLIDLVLAVEIASSSNSTRFRHAAVRLPLANSKRGQHMDNGPHKRGYEYEVMCLHREALSQMNEDSKGQMWKRLHEHFVDVCVKLNALCEGGVLTQQEASACLLVYCRFFRLARDPGPAEFAAQEECMPLPGFNLRGRLAKTNYFDHTNLVVGGVSEETLKRESERWFSQHLSQAWALFDRWSIGAS